jgi:hypothetical protein
LEQAELKSEAHLAEKKKPAADVKAAAMPGEFTCADKQILLITQQNFLLRKE